MKETKSKSIEVISEEMTHVFMNKMPKTHQFHLNTLRNKLKQLSVFNKQQ